ncbi:MAG: hypothetical protein BWY82_02256 [Verrucomicrobia bacterium ADurb.Bin474]|nr:MAG: hypothetical protein BWY82_02256 [Verrucomicrobia bacterium ADurb.Bin474]
MVDQLVAANDLTLDLLLRVLHVHDRLGIGQDNDRPEIIGECLLEHGLGDDARLPRTPERLDQVPVPVVYTVPKG